MVSQEKEDEKGEELETNQPSDVRPPKKEIKALFQQVEMLALQKGLANSFDINKLNDGQVDKVLSIVELHEKNAFEYHSKRITATRKFS
jgi:hypothetical protein